MMNHSMARPFLVSRLRRNAHRVAALARRACCSPAAERPRQRRLPRRAVPPPAPLRRHPRRPVFTPAAWTDLPGWNSDAVDAAWPAFRIGCRALLADREDATAMASAVRRRRTSRRAQPRRACAHSSRPILSHTTSLPPTAATSGCVTGYYEPLLKGSRERTAQFAVPLYAPPDDLLTVDLADLYPELKDKRVRGRVEGKKVVPYWTRADIERGPAPLPAKRSCMSPIRSRLSSSRSRDRAASQLDDGSVIRLGYADQNGHPYRSIGARADRPRRSSARTRVARGHQRVGAGASRRNAGAARRESELRLLPRSAARRARLARRRDRRAARHARRAAAGGTHDRRRSARHSSGRARLPGDHACRCRKRRWNGW